jgi:hypothetical protein
MIVRHKHLTAVLRESWLLASNLRSSGDYPGWTGEATIHSIVVESVKVEEPFRRHGECKEFLENLCADPGYDMVVVEGVGNEHLAAALQRWGWEADLDVMDFYRRRAW